jgi:putative ATP-dependent endonuclease of the OLD family
MQISRLRIENFRSIQSLDVELGETNVFIGPNNSGKSTILDALRIVLTRRWGQRGTGFTEHDVHCPGDRDDPKTLPPVSIEITLREPHAGAWDPDMVAALDDIATIIDNHNVITLRVTCGWNEEKQSFDPVWEFLDSSGVPMTGKSQRATNLSGFFGYLPLLWLGALRDAADEFTPKSGHWGRLLRGVRIPEALEKDGLQILAALDERIIAADPRLADIAELIGQATHIAIGDAPGAARLNMLPVAIEDMLLRAGVMLRNEGQRPWLPLGQHGQGLQSLAVMFLFQAAGLQQLSETDRPGMQAIYAIEEPEVHLHPQAARTLWERLQNLKGQKVMTTHSPYFVQHVPLRDLKIVRLCKGKTQVASIPQMVISEIPHNQSVAGFLRGPGGHCFEHNAPTNCVASRSWFDEKMEEKLFQCYRSDANATSIRQRIAAFRHNCRILPSKDDEEDLVFHGRRVRGEVFFARRWFLVEGVSEYLILQALGQAFECPLDKYGVSVIDFQQSGSPGVYVTLADAFGIPWHMIADGDPESEKFRGQIFSRGFTAADIDGRFCTLPPPNDLEDQLLSDGHEQILREILGARGGTAMTCPLPEFRARLKKKKTDYMSELAKRIAKDPVLAGAMPKVFVDLVVGLKQGTL